MKKKAFKLGLKQQNHREIGSNSRWKGIRRLGNLIQTVPRRSLYFGVVAMILAALLDSASIGLTIPFLKLLLNESLTLPATPLTHGINLWITQQSKFILMGVLAGILLVLIAFKSYFSYLAEALTAVYRESAVALLRYKLYAKYIHAPITFFDNEKLGTLSNTLTEVISINILIAFSLALATNIIVLTAYLVTMVLVSWQLTLLITLLIGGVGVGLSTLLNRVKSFSQGIVDTRENLNVRILDTLSGIRVVKSYATEEFELDRFAQVSDAVKDISIAVEKKVRLLEPMTEFLTMAVALLILVISYGLLISKGLLSTSELMAFMLVLIKIVPVSKRINSARGAINQYFPSVNTVAEGICAAKSDPIASGTRQFARLNQGIRFRNVSFAYNDRATVLQDFNLEIPCGKTVALVGSSGAGKTTVAALLPRFYDVTGGTILVDGHDIRDYDLASLRQKIGTVSQDIYIFNAPLRDNIAYGLAGVSEEAIVEAARLANADEFIQQLPLGYDTLVGDRGVQLSGGQRQRISIARAILRDPDILILDEATSALDSHSERLVQEALERLSQNRTVIVIAHRLSTVRNADCIVVMQQGRIIEMGDHHQLLNNRGTYWSFHNVQAVSVP